MKRIVLNGVAFIEEFVSHNTIKSTISRSKDYHGVIVAETMEITLIQAAYDLVIELDNTYDVGAVCTCVIQSHMSTTGWTTDFDGLLNFTSLKQDNKDATKKLTINAYNGEFANKLLERTDTEIPYDRLISLDDDVITPFTDEYKSVNIDGIEVISTGTGSGDSEPYSAGYGYFDFIPFVSLKSNNVGIKTVYYKDFTVESQLDHPAKTYFFFVAAANGTLKIDFILNWNYTVSGSWDDDRNTLYIDKYRYNPETGETNFIETLFTDTPATGTNTTNINIDVTIVENDCIWLRGSVFSTGTFTLYDTSTLNLTAIEKADPTPCNMVPPLEGLERIIESYTGQTNPIYTPFFGRTDRGYPEDGAGALLFSTNGLLVRQFYTGYQPLTIPFGGIGITFNVAQLGFSFKDWFENYDKIYCLGAGVIYEDGQYKLYVDDRKNFYLNEVVYEITEMEQKSFEVEKLLDLYFSQVEVGSQYMPPEEVSGLEEYLSKQKYSTPILNENKLDLITKYLTAAYPFEFARRKPFAGTESEDYKYDNEIMLFKVYRDGVNFVQHSAQDYDEVNGLDNITTYINLDITPNRIIKDFYGWLINTGLRGYQDKYLKYNKSDIVTDLSTRKISEAYPVVENADIQISTLESPKFTGRVVRFNAPVSSSTFALIAANPYGLYAYTNPLTKVKGYGYIKEVSTQLTDKATNWELWETIGFTEGNAALLLETGGYLLLETGGKILLEN